MMAAASPHRDGRVDARFAGMPLGARNDPAEAEAARVAEQAAVAAVDGSASSAGLARASPVGQEMHRLFGWDFSHVRIHDDAAAAVQAHAVQARAFTTGHDIVSGPGELSRDTASGRRTLVHELTHVVQNAKALGEQPIRRGGLADLVTAAPAAMIRRAPMDLPLGVDIANQKQRALDRERAGVEVGPGPAWSELRELGFDYVIETARSAREVAVQGLRDAAAARLPAALQIPVGFLIYQVETDLTIMTDLMLFNMSLSLGVMENVVQTVRGLLEAIVKLVEVGWHVVQALVYDVQDRLARLGLTDSPDEALIAPFVQDVDQAVLLWQTLPAALVAMLTNWRDRFVAASHEEKAVMAGKLAGDILFTIATWEASATKLGKVTLPALPALAGAEPELAVALATGSSVRAGAGALTTAGTGVAVGGPVGAGTALVLQSAGQSSAGGPDADDLEDAVTESVNRSGVAAADRTPEQVAQEAAAQLAAMRTIAGVPNEAVLTEIWGALAAAGVDSAKVDSLRSSTRRVLDTLEDATALTDAMAELQARVRRLPAQAVDTEAVLLAGQGPSSRTLAAYSLAVKQYAAEHKLGVVELHGGEDLVRVVRRRPGEAPVEIPLPAKGGVVSDADFMTEVVQDGDLILDFSLRESQHATFPHALQQIALDLRLKQGSSPMGLSDYRRMLGDIDRALNGGPVMIGSGRQSSAGSLLWNVVLDPMNEGLGSPEIISSAWLEALELAMGDM